MAAMIYHVLACCFYAVGAAYYTVALCLLIAGSRKRQREWVTRQRHRTSFGGVAPLYYTTE